MSSSNAGGGGVAARGIGARPPPAPSRADPHWLGLIRSARTAPSIRPGYRAAHQRICGSSSRTRVQRRIAGTLLRRSRGTRAAPTLAATGSRTDSSPWRPPRTNEIAASKFKTCSTTATNPDASYHRALQDYGTSLSQSSIGTDAPKMAILPRAVGARPRMV